MLEGALDPHVGQQPEIAGKADLAFPGNSSLSTCVLKRCKIAKSVNAFANYLFAVYSFALILRRTSTWRRLAKTPRPGIEAGSSA